MRLESQLTKIAPSATPYEILIESQLDWTVEKRPRYFEFNGEFKAVPGKYSLIRTDLGIELDTCTTRWQPQQNLKTIELAYDAFKSQNIQISYAGAINDSRSIVLLADWKQPTPIGNPRVGDTVEAKIMVIGSHAVNVGHKILMYINRLICTNGMTRSVLKSKKIIGHTEGAIQTIEKALSNAEQQFNGFQETANRLTEIAIDPLEAQIMLMKEFGNPGLPVEKQPKIVRIVLDLFNGKGQGSDLLTCFNTAYGLLNSLTEYYSNSEYSRSKDRLYSLVQGQAYTQTQRLESTLLNYAHSRQQNSVSQSVTI